MTTSPARTAAIAEMLASYRLAGFELFPLKGKLPAHKGWRTKNYALFDLETWLARGGNVGIRLTSRDLIIDCDPRNYQPDDDPLRRLSETVGIDLLTAPATRTGSGGLHLFFYKPCDLRIRGAEAFLHDMLSTELGEWHPREDVPQTAALANQKQESAGPELQWLWQILEDGALPRYGRDEFGTVGYIRAPGNSNAARSGPLYRHAKSSDGRLRFWSIQKFRTFLADLGVVPRRKTAGMFLFFPSLSAARAKFLELYPWYTKFTDGYGDWWSDAEDEILTAPEQEELFPDM